MKRLLTLLLAAVLLLDGCAATDTPHDEHLLDTDEPAQAPGVFSVIHSYDLSAERPTLTLTWHNHQEFPLQTTSNFDILRLGEDGLVSCYDAMHYGGDADFTLITYDIEPSQTKEISYDLSAYDLPINEELWFRAQYFAGEHRLGAFLTLRFLITEDGRVIPVATDGDAEDDKKGIYLTVDRQAVEDGHHVLDITWHNDTDTDAWFGEPYDILYYNEDGSLTSCLTDPDAAWIMPAYSIPIRGTAQKTYTPDQHGLFDLSRKGRYCFRSNAHITDTAGQTITLILQVDFTIE